MEAWVQDRAGHKINRDRRAARQLAEVRLGDLLPLDTAIPELAGLDTPGGGTVGLAPGAP